MKKADHATDRKRIGQFQQIINVGPATAEDFRILGLTRPQQLIGRDPWQLYRRLCIKTKTVHDPCVLDVLMSSIDYMNGNPPKKWWEYTESRKEKYSLRLGNFSI